MVRGKSTVGFEIALQLDAVINDQMYTLSVEDLCDYDREAI